MPKPHAPRRHDWIRLTAKHGAVPAIRPEPWYYSPWAEGSEFRTVWQSAGGATLREEIRTWQQRLTPSWWTGPGFYGPEPGLDIRVIQSDRTGEDSRMARTGYAYSSSSSDNSNNVLDAFEYDYGGTGGGLGSLARLTRMSFLTNSSYTGVNSGSHLRSLPFRKLVCSSTSCDENTFVSKTEYEYDGGFPTPYGSVPGYEAPSTPRGNATTTKVWRNLPTGGWLTTSKVYDIVGNVVSITDPRYKTATISYSSTCAYAFPTQVTNAKDQSSSAGYNCYLGRITSITDLNSVTTTASYETPLGRLKQVISASNTSSRRTANYAYTDTVGSLKVDTTSGQFSDDDERLHSEVLYDGFGRPVRTIQHEDSTTNKTDTEYDGLGRVMRVSNPYRSGTLEWTTNTYDALGRVVLVTYPDGSTAHTSYNGRETTVTDEADKVRVLTHDALGRLTSVREDPNALNYLTSYTYDAMDNLLTVSQGSQTRTFTYDSAGRLLSAANPESGTTSYTYDDNGNLLTKTAAGNVTTTMTYDDLNRVLSKSYSDSTPAVAYTYDTDVAIDGHPETNYPIGRLAQVSSGGLTTAYRYTPRGQARSSQQTTDSVAYRFGYTYNVDDSLGSMTYPSNKTVSYSYDKAGRMTTAGGYATNISYEAQGGISSMILGNGITETRSYNNRLQPLTIQAGSLLTLTYGYGTANNGNVLSQNISSLGVMQTYGYDGANRLTSAAEGTNWSQTFEYDRYGNQRIMTETGLGTSVLEPAAFLTNNRISGTGWGYDAVGNLTGNPLNETFAYDAENRQKTATTTLGTTTYAYDGEGRRVKKTVGSVTTTYVYDAMGRLAAEYGGSNTATGTQYLTPDHLGSTRLVTNSLGSAVQCRDYLPFGEEIPRSAGAPACYGGNSGVRQRFTGKERDAETGLDYFGARYFSGVQGRFTSPDRPLLDQHAGDPQSWNLYSYVRNNPLRFIDPNGDELRVSQGWDQAQQDLCSVLGTSDCAGRISYDQKTQMVSVNLKGIDLSKNAGAQLLSDLTGSASVYDLAYGSTVDTQGGRINVNFIENLDTNPDWRYGKGKQPTDLPAAGIADQVAFNWANVTPTSENSLRPADRSSVVFHELAEAFAKIDLGLPYMVKGQSGQGAHHEAMEREKTLRRERPELLQRNIGSGPGTNYPLQRRLKRVP